MPGPETDDQLFSAVLSLRHRRILVVDFQCVPDVVEVLLGLSPLIHAFEPKEKASPLLFAIWADYARLFILPSPLSHVGFCLRPF